MLRPLSRSTIKLHAENRSVTPAHLECRLSRIVILGKVGVGKATLANHIVGRPEFTVGRSVDGFTRDVGQVRTSEGTTTSGIRYEIKIFDVLGQFQKKEKDKYIEGLQEAFQSSDVNIILFVVQKGRLITEESKTLEKLAHYCPNNLLALVITGCEGLSEAAREEIREDVRTDDRSSKFAQKMGKGLYPVGFPNLDNISQHLIQEYKEEMAEDERELQKLIRNSSSRSIVPVQDIIDGERSWSYCAIL